MFAAVPLFFAGVESRLELLAMKCLEVAGGFLVGYVLGLLAGHGFDRWVYKGQTPAGLKKTVAIVAGMVLALIVALLVFVFGDGGGSGGGTGAGAGSGEGAAAVEKKDEKAPPAAKADEKSPKTVDPVPTPEKGPDDVNVPVTFLGGADIGGDKFYKVDGRPLTFDEVKAALTKRKADAGGRNVFLLVQFQPTDRIADDSVNVTQVTDWAKNAGFQVVFPRKP